MGLSLSAVATLLKILGEIILAVPLIVIAGYLSYQYEYHKYLCNGILLCTVICVIYSITYFDERQLKLLSGDQF